MAEEDPTPVPSFGHRKSLILSAEGSIFAQQALEGASPVVDPK
jgi:hypothetical protein